MMDANALQMRLDTQELLSNIKMYLSGSFFETIQGEDGNPVVRKVMVGEPKANPIGVQSIMNLCTMLVNSHVVQGNFTEDRYEGYIEECHLSIARHLFENVYKWGIDDADLNPIIDNIMLTLQAFFSRLINNKERESYAGTIESKEERRAKENNNGGLFFFSKKNRY